MRRPGDLITKDPDAVDAEGFNWTDWLAELSAFLSTPETIVTSTWAVTAPAGDATPITKTGETVTDAGRRTQVTLLGGTLGRKYTITNHIITSNGISAEDASFKVLVVSK
jgi:hypothetical protein